MAEATGVKVYCRFRPFNRREIELGGDASRFLRLGETSIEINDPQGGGAGNNFEFDRVFDMNTRQELMYDIVGRPTVVDIMDGYNGTIFAYGQTGAGKSFSMMGAESSTQPELAGLIPRATEHIFDIIQNEVRGVTFSVSVSYLEVYREVIRDLLDPTKTNLRVRESPQKGVYVDGLTTEFVSSEEDVLALLKIGDESRAVASTNMNAVSSRSHSLLIMTVHQSNEEDGSSKAGQLNLVDLAGSEKIGKTGAKGDTLEEAKKINQSLSALSNVIKGLADGKGHVPYRDSKLTRILQNSLGGNTKTSLVLAASPHPDNAPETLSTLRFGQRAKTIKTQVKKNEQRSAEELARLLEKLQRDMAELRGYVSALEKKLEEAGIALPSSEETTAAAKAVSQAVVGGAGSARVQEELDKLKDDYRRAREEMEDMKTELTEAQSEARQAESREATVQGHLARFQGLAKQAAGEIKGLRGELDHRTFQRGMAVDRITSLMIEVTEKDAEIRHLRSLQSDGGGADEQSFAEDALVQRLKRVAEDNEETQKQLHEKYQAEIKKLKDENEELKVKLSGADVDTELKQLRWLSDQTDKLVSAERAARTAGQRTVMAESAADQRVAFAQEEAASRVAEAHANIESKLQELKDAADKRVKQAQEDSEKQLTEANGRVKMGIEKAREVVMKQKVAWEGRVAEVEAKAAETLAAAKQQAEEEVASVTKSAEARLAEMEAETAKQIEAAEKSAADGGAAKMQELTSTYETKLADIQRQAEEREMAAKNELEEKCSALRLEASESLAAAKAEADAAMRTKEAEAAEALAKAIADCNDRVAAAELRETDSVHSAKTRAQEEVGHVRATCEKEVAAANAEAEKAKAAAAATKDEMTKRDQERTEAAAQKMARLEKEKDDAIAAAKQAAAEELSVIREQSKAELEKAASQADQEMRQVKAELVQAADMAAAAAAAKQESLEADNAQMKEQLLRLQQATADTESGASEMIETLQGELTATKAARDTLTEQVATLTAAKTSLEQARSDAVSEAKKQLETAEAKHTEALAAHAAKIATLEEQTAAKVADIQRQREEEVAQAREEARADADAMIEMANDDVEEAQATIEKQQAQLLEAAEKLAELEKKSEARLAETEAHWEQRYNETAERLRADQTAHAEEVAKLQSEWSSKLAAAEESGKASSSTAEQRLEKARVEAARAEAASIAKMHEKITASEDAAAKQLEQRVAEIERSWAEKLKAAEKDASEKMKAQRIEMEATMNKKLTQEREDAAAKLAEVKARAKADADAEADGTTALALEEADERVKAAEAKIKIIQERTEEEKRELEAQVRAKEAETQHEFQVAMRAKEERLIQDHTDEMNQLREQIQLGLEQERATMAKTVKMFQEEAQRRIETNMAASGGVCPRCRGVASPGARISKPVNKTGSILANYRAQHPEPVISQEVKEDFLRKKAEMTEKIAQKKEAAAAKAAAVTAKSYTVEPEGAYLVHPSGNLMPGQLYMSDKNLTFKSTIDGGMINAKVPLSDIVAIVPPTNYSLPSNAPMYFSICGGQAMSSFRVIFSTKKTKAQQLAEMKKDSGESSTEVDYIVATERAGALHAALLPYVGKEKINKRKGKMGRLAERVAYAGVSESEKPEKPAVEPSPTPSMIAGGAPPSDQTRVPPPGWEIRQSQQYPGKTFYWHEATEKSSWTYPGGAVASASPSQTVGKELMPWDGQEVTLIKPTDGSGFGMNINAECEIINFTHANSCAESGGIKVGTRIVRVNGKRVKSRDDIVPILKLVGPGDRAEFLLRTKEQTEAAQAQLTQGVIASNLALQPASTSAATRAASAPYQSKYRRVAGAGFAPADALHAAASAKTGGLDGLLAERRNTQLARSQTCVRTGFLMKKSGGYFDSVHADMGTQKAKKKPSAGQWKRRYFAITGGPHPKIEYVLLSLLL